MSFFSVSASILLTVWFYIYTHAQFRILKFQDSVYQKAEVCAQTINEWRISKRSVVLLRRQKENSFDVSFNDPLENWFECKTKERYLQKCSEFFHFELTYSRQCCSSILFSCANSCKGYLRTGNFAVGQFHDG